MVYSLIDGRRAEVHERLRERYEADMQAEHVACECTGFAIDMGPCNCPVTIGLTGDDGEPLTYEQWLEHEIDFLEYVLST